MTSSAKTLRALERAIVRAAMDWYRGVDYFTAPLPAEQALFSACARHAAALKRKRTGRR